MQSNYFKLFIIAQLGEATFCRASYFHVWLETCESPLVICGCHNRPLQLYFKRIRAYLIEYN